MNRVVLNVIMRAIRQANDREMAQIVQAVIRRYRLFFPDQEVVFLSLPLNDPIERMETHEHAFAAFKTE